MPVKARTANLRARFLTRCEGDLARIERLLDGQPLDTGELRALVHGLAGAAGTFGFPDISEAAGDCDDAFALDRLPDRDRVETLANAIRRALSRPA